MVVAFGRLFVCFLRLALLVKRDRSGWLICCYWGMRWVTVPVDSNSNF